MRREYYEIYSNLFETYGSYYQPAYFEDITFLTKIKNAIRYAVFRFDHLMIRPDAAYLLLVNFHQLTSIPLMNYVRRYRDEGRAAELENLDNYILNDAYLIIKTASEDMTGEEITSGDILKAISKVFQNLSINKVEIWG